MRFLVADQQYIHPELRNIAADLDEKELATIGHDVVES